MDEEIKVNFIRPMLVLKIRDVYKAPYHKNKYVIIRKNHVEGIREFKKKMHEYTGNWSSGLYDLQFVQKEGTYLQPTIYATFCRIEVRDGKVSKVWKLSQYSKTEYPIWTFFKATKAKPRKKKKKKITKPKKKAKKKKVTKSKKKVKKKPPKKKTKPKKTAKTISKKKIKKRPKLKKRIKKKK